MQRSEDRCDKRRFRSFNHSTCKTVLNLLEAVYFRKIVVERVTAVKFRVYNRGSDGTACFRIGVRMDTVTPNQLLHFVDSLCYFFRMKF